MLSINTNLSSLIAQSSMKTSSQLLNQAVERMTTGYKINHAKDNAANYSISTNMTTKMGALQVAEDNALQGLEMMSSTSENLSLIEEKLVRMRALAVQAQSGTYGSQSLNALSAEAGSLLNEINRINESATYNGIKLFNTGKDEVTNSAKELELNEQGFIQDVVKVDTTSMTKLSSVDETAVLAAGEYSISTVDELVKLANMANSGKITSGSKFVLAADIDIGAWCRAQEATGGWAPVALGGSTFEGNGFTISGLYINRNSNKQAFFSTVGNVNNLKMTNVSVKGGSQYVAAISADGGRINNCSVWGSISSTGKYVGGIVGYSYGGGVSYCYVNANIKANGNLVGGIIGYSNYSSVSNSITDGTIQGVNNVGGIQGSGDNITNCKSSMKVVGVSSVGGITGGANRDQAKLYFEGSVVGETNVGGLVGKINSSYSIKDAIMVGSVIGNDKVGALLGSASNTANKVNNCTYYAKNAKTEALVGGDVTPIVENIQDITIPTDYTLQIASSGDDATSTISCTTYIDFGGLKDLLSSGLESSSSIEKIDNLINIASLKQAELGMMEQRLYSVLDEISIQYENIVSSRSTILDVDIADVSSTYIQQQILQQAAATLMSTANQSPSIALQLI